jgi:hypothetical protein
VSFSAYKTVKLYQAKSAGDPSVEQLAAINHFTMKELAADEVYTRTAILAHNAVDRDGEVFDEALLAAFVRSLPGKGLFNKHPMIFDGDTGPGLGRWYAAELLDVSLDEARKLLRESLVFPPGTDRAKLLSAGYYIPRSEKNKDLIADIDAGVASDVSIGFKAAQRTDITDGNGNVIARRLHAPGEAHEGSLVWLGAQPGARTVKHATDSLTEDHDMDLKQLFDTAQADLKKIQEEKSVLQTQLTTANADSKALQELLQIAGDKTTPTDLKRLIEDGKTIRAKLVEAIISAKRLQKIVGDDEKSVTEAKNYYQTMPMAMLQKEHDAAVKAAPGGDSQLDGGDPNAGTGGGTPALKKGVFTPLSNPLFSKTA